MGSGAEPLVRKTRRMLGLLCGVVALATTPAVAVPGGWPASDADLPQLLAGATHARYELAGATRHGRQVPLLLLSTQPQAVGRQLRLLVIVQQHGDETTPPRALRLWLKEQARNAQTFSELAAVVLPRANPDGAAAGRRDNAAGADLNRDWSGQRQRETQVVQQVFARWQPHVVVDVHDFQVTRGASATPWIEWYATGNPRLDHETAVLAESLRQGQLRAGEPTQVVRTTPDRRPATLAHRHFAAEHAAVGLLFEVPRGRADTEARLLALLVDELSRRATALRPRLDAVRGLPAGSVAPAAPPRPIPLLPLAVPATLAQANRAWIVGAFALLMGLWLKLGGQADELVIEAAAEQKG